ncbi:porin family protein [Asticcacaulis excentricus]|uniref:Outer membrane protein beta-barrel domain-containing protein n=1 Tax=Asticcacaulis excentricus (strain ATCC 15261 / DSM 4724 / KCTC 12464 / NCIMB 9791 / VKM B-1370 / CB 48) TaxID=573065 RepID=E8RN99_ASTEC|nr:porin family protein [Asticcacaulis excentricus]ADU13998.1 hypothetical protein Astex_2345 [Asticcacaulis excentricus CB 48]
MRKFSYLPLVGLFMAVAASAAHAQTDSRAYGRIGVGGAKVNDETFEAVTLGFGYNLTPHFAVETDANVGMTDKEVDLDGVKLKAKLDYTAGAYALYTFPIGEQFDIFARAGYLWSKTSLPVNRTSIKESADGPAYGLGFRYFPGAGSNGVRLDATHYDFGNDLKGEIYQLSYVRKF